jgi:serine/threonine-protein kinase
MDTDQNLLFGVLALQGDLIDASQFAEACTAWAARKGRPLADLLIERGWISDDDARLVEQLLARKLKKYSGDAHKGLADAAARDAKVHATVAGIREAVDDPDVHRSLADLVSTARGTVEYISALGRPAESRDRYTLTTLHAKGGIGQVWLARDTELDRQVALKELRPEQASNATVLRRFLQEAIVTGQLDHPGVVPIYEVARGDGSSGPGGQPYYTMRFIRGRTLSDAVADYHHKRADGQAGWGDLLALVQAFLGVCQTVAFAHSRDVIHRDLKGSNIVLGEFGEVILLDWGLAKLVDRPDDAKEPEDDPAATGAWPGTETKAGAGMTAAGQVLGTPAYMAPEQAQGSPDRIGKPTDVYGLGAILYEVLTDRAPFQAPSVEEVLRQVREESPAPPRRAWKKVPRALEAVCLKALSKDPADRYGSALELASDVQHWLANEPVSAYQEPWTVRAQRWISRNRTLVASGAAALLVAAVALAALLANQTRANRELAAALAREAGARDDASAQATLAREAIQSFYAGVSEDVILRRPELEGLRRRLLGTALSFYQKLGQSLENSPGLSNNVLRMLDLARALERVASLHALIGNRDEAIRTRRKAIDLYDALPGTVGSREAAEALLNLGNVQRLAGYPDDALSSLRDALARFELLNTEGAYTSKVALALADLGRLLNDLGHVAEAQRALERARDIQEQVIQTASRRETFQQNLAATYTTLGNLFENEQQRDRALHAYETANRIYEDLVSRNPKAPYTQAELARTLNNLGLELARFGRIAEGQRTVERGLKIRDELLAGQPLNIEYRSDLARSHFHLALIQALAGTPGEALRSIRKADELYTGIPPKAPEDIYFQACLKAMRAGLLGDGTAEPNLTADERTQQRRAADEAMERLGKAIAAGYCNVPLLTNDPPLAPLRSRPDFQDLLRSIERRLRDPDSRPAP